MEYCTGKQRKIYTKGKSDRPEANKYNFGKYRDFLERASQSTSPAHNRKWEEEFYKARLEPTVTMLLDKTTRLGEDFSNCHHTKN